MAGTVHTHAVHMHAVMRHDVRANAHPYAATIPTPNTYPKNPFTWRAFTSEGERFVAMLTATDSQHHHLGQSRFPLYELTSTRITADLLFPGSLISGVWIQTVHWFDESAGLNTAPV